MALGQFFSQRFGYGVHALAYVAKKPDWELTTLPELAAWLKPPWPQASATYLSNVVQRLARGGLLRSYRGVSGGYMMARPAEKVTLRHVGEVLEGVAMDRCSLSLDNDCRVMGRCNIKCMMAALEEDYLKSLERVTIADLGREIIVDLLPVEDAEDRQTQTVDESPAEASEPSSADPAG